MVVLSSMELSGMICFEIPKSPIFTHQDGVIWTTNMFYHSETIRMLNLKRCYYMLLKTRKRNEMRDLMRKVGKSKDRTNLGFYITMSKTFLMHYLQTFKELETYASCVDLTDTFSNVTA
jgi:hypothetical protein